MLRQLQPCGPTQAAYLLTGLDSSCCPGSMAWWLYWDRVQWPLLGRGLGWLPKEGGPASPPFESKQQDSFPRFFVLKYVIIEALSAFF